MVVVMPKPYIKHYDLLEISPADLKEVYLLFREVFGLQVLTRIDANNLDHDIVIETSGDFDNFNAIKTNNGKPLEIKMFTISGFKMITDGQTTIKGTTNINANVVLSDEGAQIMTSDREDMLLAGLSNKIDNILKNRATKLNWFYSVVGLGLIIIIGAILIAFSFIQKLNQYEMIIVYVIPLLAIIYWFYVRNYMFKKKHVVIKIDRTKNGLVEIIKSYRDVIVAVGGPLLIELIKIVISHYW